MPELAYGKSAYERNFGDLPELILRNMLLEASPTEQTGIILQSRPGLTEQGITMGVAEIDGLFRADGVFNGDIFGVAGGELYRNDTAIGPISGSGFVSFAATELELLINAGGAIHRYDGSTLTVVSFPDNANVIKLTYLAGLYIAIRENSQQWYFSLDGLTWEGLDFASAEKQPDYILDAVAFNDTLVLYGSGNTVEFWQKTGDDDLPFIPIDGLVYDKGIRATGCACAFDNGMAYVSNDNIVYRSGNAPFRISTNGIEERIEDSLTCTIFAYFWEGHEIVCVRLDSGTWCYDASTQQWHETASYGEDNWLATTAIRGPIFGGPDGKLLVYGDFTELGGILERRFTAGFPLFGGVAKVNNLALRVNVGQTPQVVGEYDDPVVEMRYSRDATQTWSIWRETKLGKQGEYRTRPRWRRLGTFDEPGGVFDIRCSDPVPFRVSSVGVNEIMGGRSR